jgi:hypothetical protein
MASKHRTRATRDPGYRAAHVRERHRAEFLESYAGLDKQERAIEEFLEIANRNQASSGPEGHNWKRKDLYEERLGRFGS